MGGDKALKGGSGGFGTAAGVLVCRCVLESAVGTVVGADGGGVGGGAVGRLGAGVSEVGVVTRKRMRGSGR